MQTPGINEPSGNEVLLTKTPLQTKLKKTLLRPLSVCHPVTTNEEGVHSAGYAYSSEAGRLPPSLAAKGREGEAMCVSRRKGTVSAKVLRQEFAWCSRKSKEVRVAGKLGREESDGGYKLWISL